jgi:hypothetical protein
MYALYLAVGLHTGEAKSMKHDATSATYDVSISPAFEINFFKRYDRLQCFFCWACLKVQSCL